MRTQTIRLDAEALPRFERIQEQQSRLIAQNQDQITRLEAEQLAIRRELTNIGANVQNLLSQWNESRKPNLAVWALLLAVVPICGTLLAFYMKGLVDPVNTDLQATKTQIERQVALGTGRDQDLTKLAQATATNGSTLAAMTSQVQRVSEMALASTQADMGSKADRVQINDRLTKLEERLAEEQAQRRSATSATQVHLGEIEQQFHAVSNLRNQDTAWQMRVNALLWERAFPGTRWPTETYFPTSIFQGNGGAPIINGGSSR